MRNEPNRAHRHITGSVCTRGLTISPKCLLNLPPNGWKPESRMLPTRTDNVPYAMGSCLTRKARGTIRRGNGGEKNDSERKSPGARGSRSEYLIAPQADPSCEEKVFKSTFERFLTLRNSEVDGDFFRFRKIVITLTLSLTSESGLAQLVQATFLATASLPAKTGNHG